MTAASRDQGQLAPVLLAVSTRSRGAPGRRLGRVASPLAAGGARRRRCCDRRSPGSRAAPRKRARSPGQDAPPPLRRGGCGPRTAAEHGAGRGRELPRGREAVVARFRHRLRDELVHLGRELRADGRDRGRRLQQVRVHERHLGVPVVGGRAGEALVEHTAERVDVGAAVELLALDLLGRGVLGGPDEDPGLRQRARGTVLRHAEVGEVDVRRLVAVAGGEQDVRRLDVPVDEALAVRRAERAGHWSMMSTTRSGSSGPPA